MSTQFAVDLLFRSKGEDAIRKATKGITDVEKAAKKAQGGMDGASNGIEKFGNSAQRAGRQASTASKGVGKLGGAIKKLIGIYALVKGTKFIFVKTAELETQTRSLKVLTGSAETATKIIKQLQDIGEVTPFTSSELINSAKKLKAMNVDTSKLVDTTRRLADVSGATGAKLGEVALAYGKVQSVGRLTGETLLQFAERGIDLQGELQKMYALSGEEFREAMSKGRIGAESVEVAIQRLTEAGGQYANGAIAQSDTLNGRLSTLQDNIQRLAQNVGKILKPLFEWIINQSIRAINAINGLLNRWSKEDTVGRTRKFELQRQAALDAESKFGRFNLSKEKEQFRNSQYETYLKNDAAKKSGAVSPTAAAVETKIDAFVSAIPDLIGQKTGGSAAGSRSGGARTAATAEVEKALRPATISIVEFGKRLEALGYTVKEHPAFGGVSPVHAPNSFHKYGEAIDVTDWRGGDWMGRTKGLENSLRNSGAGFAELMGPASGAAGHETHIHIAAASGQVQLTPELAQVLGLPGGGDRAVSAVQELNAQWDETVRLIESQALAYSGIQQTQERTIELNNAQSALEKELLQNKFAYLDAVERIKTTVAEGQQDELIKNQELIKSYADMTVEREAQAKAQAAAASEKAGANSAIEGAAGGLASSLAGGLKNVLVTAIQGGDVGAAFQQLAADMGQKFIDIAFSQLEAAFEQMFTGVLGGLDQSALAQTQAATQNSSAGQLMVQASMSMMQAAQMMAASGMGGGGGGFNLGGLSGLFTPGGSLGSFGSGGFGGILGNSLSSFGGGTFPAFADGGLVTSPTTALIGEGGESEVVIPNGKVETAMSHYKRGTGAKGLAAAMNGEGGGGDTGAPVYNFETTQIMGTDYVSTDQLVAAMDEAAKRGAEGGKAQTLGTLRNSRSQRSKLGLNR